MMKEKIIKKNKNKIKVNRIWVYYFKINWVIRKIKYKNK
jgi:hypothetical protein